MVGLGVSMMHIINLSYSFCLPGCFAFCIRDAGKLILLLVLLLRGNVTDCVLFSVETGGNISTPSASETKHNQLLFVV